MELPGALGGGGGGLLAAGLEGLLGAEGVLCINDGPAANPSKGQQWQQRLLLSYASPRVENPCWTVLLSFPCLLLLNNSMGCNLPCQMDVRNRLHGSH